MKNIRNAGWTNQPQLGRKKKACTLRRFWIAEINKPRSSNHHHNPFVHQLFADPSTVRYLEGITNTQQLANLSRGSQIRIDLSDILIRFSGGGQRTATSISRD